MVYLRQTRKGLWIMKDIINHIWEGNFVRQPILLEFSQQHIELTLAAGEVYEDFFTIYGAEEEVTEGYVFSRDPRMECLTEYFSGTQEKILYRFDTALMEEGEVKQGDFQIISNHGEYSISYKVTVNRPEIESSMGTIKNLFHFANLAKTNWGEAVAVFYSAGFKEMFKGADKQYLNAYKGLSAIVGNEHNVDEFLIAIKKKTRIEYIVTESEIKVNAPAVEMEQLITVIRSGWGYTYLELEGDGDFIRLEKGRIREEDFLGNSCKISFYIQPDKLHAGNNFGCITLSNAHDCLRIPVTVRKSAGSRQHRSRQKEARSLTLQLMKYYEAFRTKKVSAATWMKQTGKIIDQMIALDEHDTAAKLYRAQLLITGERMKEAEWVLKEVKRQLKEQEFNPQLWCYYRYLTILQGNENEDMDEIAQQVERIYVQNEENWRIAWILLYLSEEYMKSPSKKWLILDKQFYYGCSSIILYIEAWHLLQSHPILLMKLDEFEMNVLGYAAKKELLSHDVILQTVYLAGKQKHYSGRMFRILKACYQTLPSDDVLAAICSLLMRGNKTDEEALTWYRQGIARELKITRLYEYYMLSLNLEQEEEIPKIVFMYFAYNSNLDYERNAYLYAMIHRRREEYSELYESYRPQIERFIIKQMSKGRMNRDLAYLYKAAVISEMLHPEVMEGYGKAIFTRKITINRKNINQILVNYDKSIREAIYPAAGKTVWLPLYGDDYFITLEDRNHNRYIEQEDYQVETFIVPDKIARTIAPGVSGQIGFDIWLCEKGRSIAAVTDDNLKAMIRVAETDYIEERYRQECRLHLLRYYRDNDRYVQLDRELNTLTVGQIANRSQAEVIQMMIERGMYERAFRWIKKSGSADLDTKIIFRLCTRLLEQDDMLEEDMLTYLIYTAFSRRKYDEHLLKYLVSHYDGATKELRNIWVVARDYGVETYHLSEKILLRILYSGVFIGQRMAIFKDYVSGGAKEMVETAFLAQCAYDYFMKDEIPDRFIIREIIRVIGRKEELNQVCKLAFLKYFAEYKEEVDAAALSYIGEFLRELIADHKYFKFFKEYEDMIPFMDQFKDTTIIEYRSEEASQVVIHYLIEKEEEGESRYITEEMQNMYGGIFAKRFILFYGENLLYYITEKSGEREYLTESATLSSSEWDKERMESKYTLLNDIIVAKNLQDYQTVDDLLFEYLEGEFLTDKLFDLQ